MKTIDQLSEVEILALSSEGIEQMIKYKMAEEGVKLLSKPDEPDYNKIPEPDKAVYVCPLFGDSLVFENMDEMASVLDILRSSTSKHRIGNDWQINSEIHCIKPSLVESYLGEWDTISTKKVYTHELYNSIIVFAKQNKKLKENYDVELKEYISNMDEAKWIRDEITGRVYEVQDKYYNLNNYCRMFKNDYLPLSGNNKEVAMSFLNKAYGLSEETKQYVLSNYEKV